MNTQSAQEEHAALNSGDSQDGVTGNMTSGPHSHTATEITPALDSAPSDLRQMQNAPMQAGAALHDLAEDDSDDTDYYALLDELQKQFLHVYHKSVDLFEEERAQRKAMIFYQQRNNALLELLTNIEPQPDANFIHETSNRIENIIEMNPALASILEPLVRQKAPLKPAHKLNMFLHETIPETSQEIIEEYERNPQDLEPWACRHIPHLTNPRYRKRFLAQNTHK